MKGNGPFRESQKGKSEGDNEIKDRKREKESRDRTAISRVENFLKNK